MAQPATRARHNLGAALATAIETRNVVVLAGPGGTAFDESDIRKTVDALKKNGADVILVGDGKRAITNEEIAAGFNQASQNGLPTTVMVDIHGSMHDGVHVLNTDGKYSLTSEQLFKTISHSFGSKAVDIFMTSCYGGQAANVAGVLPKGSHLVTLAPSSAEVQEQDVDHFISSLGSGSNHNLSAQGMLNLYLIHGMENRVTPSMAIAGNGSYDLRGAMLSHLGKPFSESEKTSIYDKLGTTMPREQIDATMKKVASAKSEWDISAKEYGPVLAIMMATSQPTTNPITPDNDGTRQGSPKMLEKTPNIRPLQFR